MAPKRTDNKIKKRQADMGIDWDTSKRRSSALRTGGGGPGSGASGTQHAITHHTPQWESVRLEARAREAKSQRASASVSAPPPMPGPAVLHQLNSPPRSLLSFSESPAQAASVMIGIGWATGRQRFDVLRTGGGGPSGGASGMQHAMTHHTPQRESARHEARAREAQRLQALAASTYGTQPVQQAHEEARNKEDHPRQQQRWGDHFIDVVDADMLAAEYTGMLLDESLHEQQMKIEKKYWEGIMHLVNSPLEKSVAAMPAALEASSSVAAAASSSTSAAVPAPTLIQRGTSDPSRPA